MAEQDIFEKLKKALTDLKDFLKEKATIIKPALPALDRLTNGAVKTLITKLVSLLGDLKEVITKIDIGPVAGPLNDLTTFTEDIKTVLTVTKELLPKQATEIDELLSVTKLVTGLPNIEDVKAKVIPLIDEIVADLKGLVP